MASQEGLLIGIDLRAALCIICRMVSNASASQIKQNVSDSSSTYESVACALRLSATGSVSRQGAARVRDGCYLLRRPWRRGDSGRRQSGAATLPWGAGHALRWAERPRGTPELDARPIQALRAATIRPRVATICHVKMSKLQRLHPHRTSRW
jgi:hypothetical protein